MLGGIYIVKTGVAGKRVEGLLKAAPENLIQMTLAQKLITIMKNNMKIEQNLKHHEVEDE